jgi:hypothetical protein
MIAERKRRREMRGVFEQLADLLPAVGARRSKWEALVDAVDYIDTMEARKVALIGKIRASTSS